MERSKEAALAFFYCSGVVSQKRDARLVIGSILKQLIRRWSARTGISQMTLISPLYEKFKESDGTSVLEEFSAQITALSTMFESAYVIIDGLDEITDAFSHSCSKRTNRDDEFFFVTYQRWFKRHICKLD